MRTLIFVKTDSGQQILERKPGPYSHSAPVEVVVFEMSHEEAATVETEDRTSPPEGAGVDLIPKGEVK